MQARLRMISYYLLELISTILVLLFVGILVIKITLLNPNYLKKQIAKTNYYAEVNEDISEEMSYYILQSGLDNSVIEDLHNLDMVKKDIDNYIDNIYAGEAYVVDTNVVKNNLEAKINAYLESANVKVSNQEELDMFIDQIVTVYKNKIIINDQIPKYVNKIPVINKIVTVGIIGLGILILILLFVTRVISKKMVIPIPCLATALMIFIGNFSLFKSLELDEFFFWNKHVSELLKEIVFGISSYMNISAVILLIICLICLLIRSIRRLKIVKR